MKMKMGDANKEKDITRKKLKTVPEMKNASYRLIIRLHIDEERTSDFEVRSTEIFQPETQRGKYQKRKTMKLSRIVEHYLEV